MPYHVRVTLKSNPTRAEVRLDLDFDQLNSRFLEPYKTGRPITIGGATVPMDNLARIRITRSDQTAEELRPQVQAERALSKAVTLLSDDWYIAKKGKDVTDELITEGPGALNDSALPGGPLLGGTNYSRPDLRDVFVVHGRNYKARDSMFAFLRALGLQPIEWNEAVLATGKPNPYVGEVLSVAFERAQTIIVLMTPDDEARLRVEFHEAGDPPHEIEITPQARPNVLFEAGMAMGRDENRTVLVELGHCRPFSDIGGRHTIRLNDSTQRRQELAQRLQSAGAAVKLAGTDWHTAGSFAPSS